jgi:hypothetical protein
LDGFWLAASCSDFAQAANIIPEINTAINSTRAIPIFISLALSLRFMIKCSCARSKSDMINQTVTKRKEDLA